MRLECKPNKPSLLMLSDHFPDPDGCRRAARAWDLLNYASTTHDLYLSAVTTRQVNFQLWRRVAKHTRRIHIASSSRPWIKPIPFSGEAVAWADQQRFDSLLVTSPEAWPVIFPGQIRMAICDIAYTDENIQQNAGESAGRSLSLFALTRRQDKSRTRLAHILPACDRLLVASQEHALAIQKHRSKVITLSGTSALDTWARLFNRTAGSKPTTPTLAVLPVKPIQARQAA